MLRVVKNLANGTGGRAACLLVTLGLTACSPEVQFGDPPSGTEDSANGQTGQQASDDPDWAVDEGGAGSTGRSNAADDDDDAPPRNSGRDADDDADDDDDDADDDDDDVADESDESDDIVSEVSSGGGGAAARCTTVEENVLDFMETSCAAAGCHGTEQFSVFGNILNVEALKDRGLILPGNAVGSLLYKRTADGSMPKAPFEPATEQEVEWLQEWIDDCLDEPDDGGDLDRIDEGDLLAEALSDALRVDQDDREFTRYFSLAHVVNAGGSESELKQETFALFKALNFMSLGTRLVEPEAVDDAEVLFRVDIRDLEWDRAVNVDGQNFDDKWERMISLNPFAFAGESDDAEELQDQVGTLVPIMSGSWFVHDATVPPLYHDIMEIPENFADLAARLGVDVEQNILDGEIIRAGFLDSGVSGNNRVVERHELPAAANQSLWISYDFADNGGNENIFANPLDFEDDGSEIIFSLPNGMHGYMVALADGTRLDEAPTEIVVDPQQFDHNVRNGFSCMSCHFEGIKPKTDELRDHVLESRVLDDEERDDALEIYVGAEAFNEVVEDDANAFKATVARLAPDGVEYVGTDKDEPLLPVYLKYETNLTLEQAAAELGVSAGTLNRELGRLNDALAPLGNRNGTVKRSTFEDTFAESVCLLQLGEPIGVDCNDF